MSERMYKVVIRQNGKLTSIVKGEARVEYSDKKWACPPEWLRIKGYGLTVFPNKESAMSFARVIFGKTESPQWEIWECETEGKFTLPPRCIVDLLAKGILKEISSSWFAETVMVEKVKLTRRIM